MTGIERIQSCYFCLTFSLPLHMQSMFLAKEENHCKPINYNGVRY